MERIEVKEISIPPCCRDAQDILQGLGIFVVSRKRLELHAINISSYVDRQRDQRPEIHTILIEASVRLMKVGGTSWFPAAASSAAASQIDRTVPVSTAKHSTHFRSGLGRPSGSTVRRGSD